MVNKYNQKHKEKLRKEAHERYQNLSKEEKLIYGLLGSWGKFVSWVWRFFNIKIILDFLACPS